MPEEVFCASFSEWGSEFLNHAARLARRPYEASVGALTLSRPVYQTVVELADAQTLRLPLAESQCYLRMLLSYLFDQFSVAPLRTPRLSVVSAFRVE